MDRVLFGSNTILVFKYPLLKRMLQQMKSHLLETNPGITAEDLETKARASLVSKSLLVAQEEESKDEDELRRQQITVADYTEDEIEEDINGVDWDFAYNEILKIDERKRDKAKMEQEEALQKERQRVEQEMEAKLEEERKKNMDEVQRMMDEKQRHAEELKV